MPLPNPNITPLPSTEPDAVPALWNTRYLEIDANFANHEAKVIAVSGEVQTARGVSATLGERLDSIATAGQPDPKLPTQAQKDALAGFGATPPSGTNKYATQSDLSPGGGDNLGNHTATQDINFANLKGVNCAAPVNPLDVANRQFVLANIGGQNLASSVSQLRKHVLENQLLLEGMTNSPYPDNFGQPFFRTEFDNVGNYVEAGGKRYLESDHDLKKLTARIVSLKDAERGRIDTRLQLPTQKYFGEIIKFIDIPDIADRPHSITYAAETQKIYMITYGVNADDTVLHCIDPLTLQIEASWFFDEASFSRWNGRASGITFGAGQLFLIEHDPDNLGAVCIRFRLNALPPKGIKISKWNTGAIESANSVDSTAAEAFMDIAHDAGANLLWAMKKTAASNHKLTRLKADFIENGTLAFGGVDVTTSAIDTSINGIDFDGNFLWFTGDTWTGRMGVDGVVNAKFKKYGKTGICRITDVNLPTMNGHLCNTDEVNNVLNLIAVKNTFSLPASAVYKPINAPAVIASVNNIAKTVTVNNIGGGAATFAVNEFKGFNMRVGNVYWKVTGSAANVITLDTTADISALSGNVELGIARRNVAVNLTDRGTKIYSYEGGVDNVAIRSAGFMLDRNTEAAGAAIELGAITTQGNIELRIETSLNGAPTGILVNANASAVIAAGSLAANAYNSKAFPGAVALSPDTIYHLVIVSAAAAEIKGHINGNNRFGAATDTINFRLYNSAKLATNKVSGVAVNNKKLYVGYKESAGTQVLQPDAAAGNDTHIIDGLPTSNFATDAFLKLGATVSDGTSADTWGRVIPQGLKSVIWNNKIYGVGPYGGNELWEYDFVTGKWTQKSASPVAFGGLDQQPAVTPAGKLYIYNNHGADLLECDLANNFTWTDRPIPAVPQRFNCGLAIYNNNLYVFGGKINGVSTNELWECNLSTFVWTLKTVTGTAPAVDGTNISQNGSKIYIFKGHSSAGVGASHEKLWECDLAAFTWTDRTTASFPLSAATGVNANGAPVVILNNKLYIAGGAYDHASFWACDLSIIPPATAPTFAWTQLTSLPAGRGRYNHSVLAYNNLIYVVQGWTYEPVTATTTYKYDMLSYDPLVPASGWNVLADMAQDREFHGFAYANGKIYLFGGTNPRTMYLDDLAVFDLTTKKWAVLSPAGLKPSGRYRATMSATSTHLYMFGGDTASGYVNDLWVYDIAANSWTQITAAGGPSNRIQHSSAIVNNKLYIYGGFSSIGGKVDDLWEFDIATQAWTQRTVNVTGEGRAGLPMAALNGKLYLFGGNGVINTYLNDLWEYTPAAGAPGSWLQKASGATARANHNMAAHNGKLYVTCGESAPGYLNDLWEYTPAAGAPGSWLQKAAFPGTARRRVGVDVNPVNGKLYLFGGGSVSYAFNDLWQYNITSNVAGKSRGLVKFDLTGLPSTAVSASLGLHLSAADTANKTVNIHQLTAAFTEGQATWNQGQTGTNWTTAGGDYNAAPANSKAVTNAVGFVEFDITSIYNAWKSGTINNGLLVKLSNESAPGEFIDFISSDHSNAGQRPRLTVDAYATRQNIGVMVKDKLANVGFDGSITQAIDVIGDRAYIALTDRIRILDSSDNTIIQDITNATFPQITSTIIKGMVVKELVVDHVTHHLQRFLIAVCDNGVTVINLDTGAYYPVRNYELASSGAACKTAAVTDKGNLIIVTESSAGIDQIDIFGDIGKLFTSYTNKTWDKQTGFRKTLTGPNTTGGILPFNVVNGVSTVTKVDDLRGYDTSLVLIANAQSLLEYDITREKLAVIDSAGASLTCKDVAYWQGETYAIFTGGGVNELRQYRSFDRRLLSITGNSTKFNSLIGFELAQDFTQLLVKEDKIMATTSAGLEIIDVAMIDTGVFGNAEWFSEQLKDPNGIARATVLLKGITLPRELNSFASAAAKGANSVSVNFGRAGNLLSAGDTLILFSTSGVSAGQGEEVLIKALYNEISTVIPFASTTLNENIDNTSTDITLLDMAIVEAMPMQGVIKIDAEEIMYNGKSGATVLVLARGVNGTIPAAHNIGAAVSQVLRFDYLAGDPIVFRVSKKQTDKLVDVRVLESSDAVSYAQGGQILIEDTASGYYKEAVRSDLQYGQLKIGLKRTDYEEDSVMIDGAAVYWENY